MKTHLVIHHSLSNDGTAYNWQAIRRYHVEERGWQDIGYHIGVELIKDRYEIGMGRPLMSHAAAAYQQRMNRRGIHVCFVGNFDAMEPPKEMLRFAAPHLRDICEAFEIPLDADHIIGHRSVASYKTCPGAKFDMDALRIMLRG